MKTISLILYSVCLFSLLIAFYLISIIDKSDLARVIASVLSIASILLFVYTYLKSPEFFMSLDALKQTEVELLKQINGHVIAKEKLSNAVKQYSNERERTKPGEREGFGEPFPDFNEPVR